MTGPVPGTRLTTEGPLSVVGEYEWEAFDLTDTRADWCICGIVEGGLRDDIKLDVEPIQLTDRTN